MSNILIAAYRMRPVEGVELSDITPTPPKNYKPETAAKWVEEKKLELAETAVNQPYTGTFDEVMIADPSNQRVGRWRYRPPGGEKQIISLAVRQWLLSKYPDAWPNTANYTGKSPQAIFVGFNPRLFLKTIGIECSLPANQPVDKDGKPDVSKSNALPLSLWYSNSDHRDIAEAVMPRDYTLSWPLVLRLRGLPAAFAEWTGPGQNVETDLALATELASQLGMLNEPRE